jgi:hypothetical protein
MNFQGLEKSHPSKWCSGATPLTKPRSRAAFPSTISMKQYVSQRGTFRNLALTGRSDLLSRWLFGVIEVQKNLYSSDPSK